MINKNWDFVLIKEEIDPKPKKFYYDNEFGAGVLIVNDMDKIQENNKNLDINPKRDGDKPLDIAQSKRGAVCIITFLFWQQDKGWQYLISNNCDLKALQELKDLFKGEFAGEVETAYRLAKIKTVKELLEGKFSL